MIDSETIFLTKLPVNQTAAADALTRLAVDFNGFFVIGKERSLAFYLQNAIALAAVNGFSRMIIEVGVNLPDDKVGMTEMGIDIALTQSQGGTVSLIAEEPLATILREKGIELGSFKLGTTEAHYIHPNLAFAEAEQNKWNTSVVTVGFPNDDWFDIRRGEVNQDTYPYPVLVIDPVPPAAWKAYRFAAVVFLVGFVSMVLTGTKTIPIVLMTLFLYAYYRSVWVRSLILGTCLLSIVYFWME
jgi:hypothetical protein